MNKRKAKERRHKKAKGRRQQNWTDWKRKTLPRTRRGVQKMLARGHIPLHGAEKAVAISEMLCWHSNGCRMQRNALGRMETISCWTTASRFLRCQHGPSKLSLFQWKLCSIILTYNSDKIQNNHPAFSWQLRELPSAFCLSLLFYL